MDKEKLKKVATGTGGVSIIGVLLMLHSDIRAEIKTGLSKIEAVVERVTVLETREKIMWKNIEADIKEIKEDVKYMRRIGEKK